MLFSSVHASARPACPRGTARLRTARTGGIPLMAQRRTVAASSACPSPDDTPTSGVESSVFHGADASRLLCLGDVPVGQARGRNHRGRLQEPTPVVVLSLVEAEHLLVNVRAEVERLHRNIRARK